MAYVNFRHVSVRIAAYLSIIRYVESKELWPPPGAPELEERHENYDLVGFFEDDVLVHEASPVFVRLAFQGQS